MKTAILISGRGSNMRALLDAASAPSYPAEIICVISNEPNSAGLEWASSAGIETEIINHRDYDGRTSFEDALHKKLKAVDVELICLAGFMRLLTEHFVSKWQDRIINIHPSLLPSYKGLNTHKRALADGVKFTGCTVHFVRSEMDDGPIIAQAVVPVRPEDDPNTLAARVLAAEHECYAFALRLVACGATTIVNRTVEIVGAIPPETALFNPNPKPLVNGHSTKTENEL